MAAHINLADWRFVKLIAAMDRTRGWREGGYCNLGNWLDHRCGLGPCAARERIRIGRALERLPRIDAAFREGVISYSKVRAITRVGDAGDRRDAAGDRGGQQRGATGEPGADPTNGSAGTTADAPAARSGEA